MHLNWEIVGIWVAAGMTLAIYSFLYKDNPFYKLAEYIYVGVSTGYIVCTAWDEVLKSDLWNPVTENFSENWHLIIPGILGLLMFTRFSEKFAWLSRYPLAFIIGSTVGYAAPNTIQTYIIRHTGIIIQPIVNMAKTGSFLNSIDIDAIITIVGVVCILIYFFFSIEHKGILKPVAYTGIIYLMICFGAMFGYTMMGRLSLLIGRVNFLIEDWIKSFLTF